MTHYAFLSGATKIQLYRTVEEAWDVKRRNEDFVLAGERKSKKIEGFDMQNSPAEVAGMDLSGKTIILTTTNGVPSALNALQCGPVFVTGFSNARSTAKFARQAVQEGRVSRINIVGSHPSGEEDMLCAHFIETLILGQEEADGVERMRAGILASGAAQKFLDSQQPDFDENDMDYCCRENPSDFVMELNAGDHPTVLPVSL